MHELFLNKTLQKL